jgi:hypothetical protein
MQIDFNTLIANETYFNTSLPSGGYYFVNNNNSGFAPVFCGALNAAASVACFNGSYSSPGISTGDMNVQRSASTGQFWLGGGTAWMTLNFGTLVANEMYFNSSIVGLGYYFVNSSNGAYAPVYGQSFTNSSDATLKTNKAPITGALETVMLLKPQSFDWIVDGQPDFGFMAQEVNAVLPQICRTDSDGRMGVVYTGLTTHAIAAIQEIAAKLKAAGIAGF